METLNCEYCKKKFKAEYQFLVEMKRQDHYLLKHRKQFEEKLKEAPANLPKKKGRPPKPQNTQSYMLPLKGWCESKIGGIIVGRPYTYILDYKIVDEDKEIVEFVYEKSLSREIESAVVQRPRGRRSAEVV